MQYTIVEKRDRVAYLILNRPDKRNALNFPFVDELKRQFQELLHDPDTRVIVLKANGKAFCAGADLGYIRDLQHNSYEENLADSNHLMELFRMIYLSPKPVISMVDGPALAGGCGLATVGDFCFASVESTFGYTEARIGFVPAVVMVFLLRKTSDAIARELMLTGDVIDAEKARSMGLINHVTTASELEEYVHQFAVRMIALNSGMSQAIIKEMISKIQDLPLEQALKYASESNARARKTVDCQRGIAAFLNKEKIMW